MHKQHGTPHMTCRAGKPGGRPAQLCHFHETAHGLQRRYSASSKFSHVPGSHACCADNIVIFAGIYPPGSNPFPCFLSPLLQSISPTVCTNTAGRPVSTETMHNICLKPHSDTDLEALQCRAREVVVIGFAAVTARGVAGRAPCWAALSLKDCTLPLHTDTLLGKALRWTVLQ